MESELDRKEAELQEALEELQATHDLVQERAVEVYKDGPVSFVGFLLGAEDLRSLVSRAEFVHRVFRSDEERIVSLEEQKARVQEEREQVEELRDRAAEQVEAVRAERNRTAAFSEQVGARASALRAELAEQYGELDDVQARKEQYLRQQEELEAESRRVASLLRGRTGGEATVGRGGMIWPASGPLTSGYGWRTHPIFGTKRFHAGIDIGAPTGAPVSAAATGTVVHASAKGGYGNAVIVDHGGGVATLYGHLSSVSTSHGATVARGETIGGVGCSGYCTGPHLHFEVRVNGDPQDPMRWY
jgi:murein DD-endopeptidase MepM/ murein hydrolase activator NlpD